ncbi:MAG TPA: sigma 54-interacting transcriptional regulator [Blastocatellia bacterium]|nr:sigma 54-interacting transcriptional regulator [Blastocatellia bacterium]
MANPKLIALDGTLKGSSIPLFADEVWIGRDRGNHIQLSDPMVSRRHCRIRLEGDSLKLRDESSSNGTLVNDVPVRERDLSDGDLIKIGDSHFLVILSEDNPGQSGPKAQLDDSRIVTKTTIMITPDEAVYLRPDKVASLPASDRMARDLNSLLRISRAIIQIRELAGLQRQVMELIFEVIPAETGAIILSNDRFVQPDPFVWVGRQPAVDDSVNVSRTVVDRVMRGGEAILSNDILESETLSGVKSLLGSQTQSLLCVPLTLYDQTLGVIYLATKNPDVLFDEDHLQLLTAVAGIAAVAFDNAAQIDNLRDAARLLKAELDSGHAMIGESEPMRAVYQLISRAAPSDSTVLILGESGTGKELAARAIHNLSPRADKPFVAINCAGLSDTLLESDLFGHEKGSFTGAMAQKKGRLEIADGGTVFLDEMGELPMPLQAKLLRVLQTREFERVGGTRAIKIDIRLIAATNRDLETAIKDGSFRADLYYRLNVVSLTMPALRDRRDDIPLLAHYFTVKYGQKCKRPVRGLAPATKNLLISYDWPGNVRELENVIERAVVLGSTEMIQPEDLPESLNEVTLLPNAQQTKFHSAAREAKRQIVLHALDEAGGNYTNAAKILGIHPNNLHRLARNLGLKTTISDKT